jgi:hydrogenase expression/formation protein HypC
MCLAIPGKIISIEDDTAVVDYDGIRKEANISLVDCSIGDYVLVHVGFVIQIVDEETARSAYSLLDEADRRIHKEGAGSDKENDGVDGSIQ